MSWSIGYKLSKELSSRLCASYQVIKPSRRLNSCALRPRHITSSRLQIRPSIYHHYFSSHKTCSVTGKSQHSFRDVLFRTHSLVQRRLFPHVLHQVFILPSCQSLFIYSRLCVGYSASYCIHPHSIVSQFERCALCQHVQTRFAYTKGDCAGLRYDSMSAGNINDVTFALLEESCRKRHHL